MTIQPQSNQRFLTSERLRLYLTLNRRKCGCSVSIGIHSTLAYGENHRLNLSDSMKNTSLKSIFAPFSRLYNHFILSIGDGSEGLGAALDPLVIPKRFLDDSRLRKNGIHEQPVKSSVRCPGRQRHDCVHWISPHRAHCQHRALTQ